MGVGASTYFFGGNKIWLTTHTFKICTKNRKGETFWSSFSSYRFICLSDVKQHPQGHHDEWMRTCLTAGATQLALDQPVPVGGLENDRAAGGKERIYHLKCTWSNTTLWWGIQEQRKGKKLFIVSSCTGHSPKCQWMLDKIIHLRKKYFRSYQKFQLT